MRAAGFLLLWGGFLAGSFVSLCRLEQTDAKWSTVPWVWYAVSIGIGVAGIVLLRKARQEEDQDDERTQAEFSVVRDSLSGLVKVVDELCHTEPPPRKVLQTIDGDCADHFSEFAEARQALVKRFGLSVYAEVMTEFASAERYVNRSWSAAADGYVDEIKASLSRASGHLAKAQDLLAAAESQAT